jgi:hypothetical protein
MNLFSFDFLSEMERMRREIDRVLGEDNILTIKGKADYIPPASLLRGEFNLQGYYRQFQLSDDVDQSKITAESKNGVLAVCLPKAEKSKPRRIKVKLGACPRISRGRAHGDCEASSRREEEAMSLHIVDDEQRRDRP